MENYFDVDSLAKYLHLLPEQVRKMAEREQVPGQRVAGEWRFPKREIYHWFEERIGISDEPQLRQYETLLERHHAEPTSVEFSVTARLPESLIWLDCRGRSRNSLIRDVAQFLADQGYLWDPVRWADAIQAREQLHSTALENGVALLHPRRPQPDNMREPFLALIRTPSGIPFGGPRGQLTDLFFVIGSDSDALHLKILARLTRLLSQPQLIPQLRQAPDAQTIRMYLEQSESQLG